MDVEKIIGWTLGIAVLGLALTATTCVVTGVQRDRAFENACRKAGGYIGYASSVSSATASGKEVCLEVVTPPVSKPIPLPGYQP